MRSDKILLSIEKEDDITFILVHDFYLNAFCAYFIYSYMNIFARLDGVSCSSWISNSHQYRCY